MDKLAAFSVLGSCGSFYYVRSSSGATGFIKKADLMWVTLDKTDMTIATGAKPGGITATLHNVPPARS